MKRHVLPLITSSSAATTTDYNFIGEGRCSTYGGVTYSDSRIWKGFSNIDYSDDDDEEEEEEGGEFVGEGEGGQRGGAEELLGEDRKEKGAPTSAYHSCFLTKMIFNSFESPTITATSQPKTRKERTENTKLYETEDGSLSYQDHSSRKITFETLTHQLEKQKKQVEREKSEKDLLFPSSSFACLEGYGRKGIGYITQDATLFRRAREVTAELSDMLVDVRKKNAIRDQLHHQLILSRTLSAYYKKTVDSDDDG